MSWPLYILLISTQVMSIFNYVDAITTDSISSNSQINHFNHCLRQSQHSRFRECVGRTALSFLQRLDEYDNFTLISGIVAKKDDKVAGRALINLFDADPEDLRGILENAGAVFSERSMEWHMNTIYPGLMLRIGPTADANSMIEFMIDPAEHERTFPYQEPSTGRVLVKTYLLPLLLGLKFNLAALVPLIFAAICLLLKKSLLLFKLVIYFSSILGFGVPGTFFGGSRSFATLENLLSGQEGSSRPILDNWSVIPANVHRNKINQEPYTTDDIFQNSPPIRNGRKSNMDRQRDSEKLFKDSFYDYEKMVMQLQPREISNSDRKALGPSAFVGPTEKQSQSHFRSNVGQGWKVVDLTTKIPL